MDPPLAAVASVGGGLEVGVEAWQPPVTLLKIMFPPVTLKTLTAGLSPGMPPV